MTVTERQTESGKETKKERNEGRKRGRERKRERKKEIEREREREREKDRDRDRDRQTDRQADTAAQADRHRQTERNHTHLQHTTRTGTVSSSHFIVNSFCSISRGESVPSSHRNMAGRAQPLASMNVARLRGRSQWTTQLRCGWRVCSSRKASPTLSLFSCHSRLHTTLPHTRMLLAPC